MDPGRWIYLDWFLVMHYCTRSDSTYTGYNHNIHEYIITCSDVLRPSLYFPTQWLCNSCLVSLSVYSYLHRICANYLPVEPTSNFNCQFGFSSSRRPQNNDNWQTACYPGRCHVATLITKTCESIHCGHVGPLRVRWLRELGHGDPD